MSQKEQAVERTDLMYETKLSYHVVDFNAEGHQVETKLKDQTIKLWKLQRRNKVHSKLAMDVLFGRKSPDELAVDFANACVVDENVAKDIAADMFAAFELFSGEAVQTELESFFEGWEYLKATPQSPLKNK